MDFDEYQRRTALTDQIKKHGPHDSIAAMLGLASETGSVLNLYKKHLRDGVDLREQRDQLKEELGDALWYISTIARAFDLSLNDIAEANMSRTTDLYVESDLTSAHLGSFDADYPEHERFPRRLVVEFRDEQLPGVPVSASLFLIEADPNPFPEGRITTPGGGRPLGFTVGQQLGNRLRDNSSVPDEYRFHDAVHMAFMAILGWSATFRTHLRVKRKSRPEVDDTEDSARSSFREEGLVAVLAQLAEQRRGFESMRSVDSTALSIVEAAVAGLEVAIHPRWLWRRAISEGFQMMRSLREHGGGFLRADLDRRSIEFYAEWPPTSRGPSQNS